MCRFCGFHCRVYESEAAMDFCFEIQRMRKSHDSVREREREAFEVCYSVVALVGLKLRRRQKAQATTMSNQGERGRQTRQREKRRERCRPKFGLSIGLTAHISISLTHYTFIFLLQPSIYLFFFLV